MENIKKRLIFALALPKQSNNAQMAESVDALVSNTSGAIRAGSIPALGTVKKSLVSFTYEAFIFLKNNQQNIKQN